jgi:2-iminobutanoate/2-iminopropanoate deaminase
MKKIISTLDAPGPAGPYSQAVRAGAFLFCAGQIALDPKTGQLVSKEMAQQTRQVLDNLCAVLAAEKMTPRNVVRTTVFLQNMADYEIMNEIYSTYFAEGAPARTTVQVSGLPRGARIEVDAIAVADCIAP